MRLRSLAAGAILLISATASWAQQPPALVPQPDASASQTREIRSFQITSALLKQTRRIQIALPASFAKSAPDRRYPVVIVLDGESNTSLTATVSDQLARHGLIPETIIVGIENVDPLRGRVHDLTPPGLSVSGSSMNEGGDRFLDFIEQELLAAVDRQFRGAAPRILIGHSSGAILATYASATRVTYRAVVAIDEPIYLGDYWLAKRLIARAAAASAPLRFAYYEARFPWPEESWKALTAAAPPSWKLHQEKLALEGHETVFLLAAYLGLREVFSDYSRLAAPVAPTTRILPYYATVSESFGATLVPPERIVRDVVDDLMMEGRGAAAREAYHVLVSGYGAPADSAKLLAEIADVERRPPPAETVEGLLATPFPTPEEAKAYIGEWVGDVWVNPEQPRTGRQTLRIRVVDGRVVGESVHGDAPGGPLVIPWQYMKVTPDGLAFGYMNGMRPRGVVLFEAKLEGGTLSGTQRFGGINFRRPAGFPEDTIHFAFKRVE
jgi:hypothetical protein